MSRRQVTLVLRAVGDDPDPAGEDHEFDWSQVERCVAVGWTVINPPMLPDDFQWPEGVVPCLIVTDTAHVWMEAEEGVSLPPVAAGYCTSDSVSKED